MRGLMREWSEQLSEWIEEKEEMGFPDPTLTDFSDELDRERGEADSLLQAAESLYTAYSQILENAQAQSDYGNS